MTRRTLLRRGLRYHWRAHFALMLGVVVGAAVLTGALLVGDSLRGSLRMRAEKQLLGVQSVIMPGRLVRQDLADAYSPLIYMRGTVQSDKRRAADVTVHTNAAMFFDQTVNLAWRPSWRVWETFTKNRQFKGVSRPCQIIDPSVGRNEAMISPALAAELNLHNGDRVQIRVPKASALARETLFGRKTSDDLSMVLEYRAVIPPDTILTDFSLMPGVAPARTVVLEHRGLQERLGEVGRVNAFVAGDAPASKMRFTLADFDLPLAAATSRTAASFQQLDRDNSDSLEPREYRHRFADSVVETADTNRDKTLSRAELEAYFQSLGYFALESKSLLLNPIAEKAAHEAAAALNLKAEPALVYLANSISDGTGDIPYSVIAAMPTDPTLADDEILLADWADSPLPAKTGDTITIKYFLPESEGKPVEATATFKLKGKVAMTGRFADPYLTPEFPGITDKLSLGEWDPPFPYDNKRIGKRDDDYWERYRTTPKAYINSSMGRKLFGSRWGQATSVRVFSDKPGDAAAFEKELLKRLDPADFGFAVEDVRSKALTASQGNTDFGGLFLGFSFYLIAAALLLVALLTKLNLERRASEIGLLLAAGYRAKAIRGLLLRETLIVAAIGAVIGVALAIAYAQLMLRLLVKLWPEGSIGTFLDFHAEPKSLVIGYFGTLFAVAVTLWLTLRGLRRVEPVQLLRGVFGADVQLGRPTSRWPVIACAGAGLASVIGGTFAGGPEARAGSFLAGGALLLVAGLLTLRWLLRNRSRSSTIRSTRGLGARNLARNPTRSLLTAGVLASATFLLIAVDAFRRSPEADFASKSGGSGGYNLVASTDLPLYYDPAAGDIDDPTSGRGEALAKLRQPLQPKPTSLPTKMAAAMELWDQTTFMPLRVHGGDDAGCRNLYRPTQPRLVGVPRRFRERGGFRFGATLAKSKEERDNPWLLLDKSDDAIPVFGEANTVTYMLHLGVGDVLTVNDAAGKPVNLRIAGLLHDSVFRGELVMAEEKFLRAFPETQGYGMMLLDAPSEREGDVCDLLQTAYADRGIVVTPSIDRLRSYLAIENTYLSTFQILGGFGLLLGACGLAVVLLRSAWERRGESALLRALGYRPGTLASMAFAESAVLLMAGLAIGVLAALMCLTPHLITSGVSVSMVRTAILLLGMVAVGLLASLPALLATRRTSLIAALRQE